jgi:hypothetical protein
MNWSDDYDLPEPEEVRIDPVEEQAKAKLREFFNANPERVFFSRQLEVQFEGEFFHWVTNRALRHLIEEAFLAHEFEKLKFGGSIKLIWKRTFRYHRRAGAEIVKLVSEYSLPPISEALGNQGETMVLSGLAVNGFSIVGRHACSYREKVWTETEHNLDMVVERDGIGYGVEVKNTLPYIDQEDYKAKKALCEHLGLRPLFAVRMMPKTWINETQGMGGYCLIMKWQLYPWGHKELARRVEVELGLPVRCVSEVEQGLMERLLTWHKKHVK